MVNVASMIQRQVMINLADESVNGGITMTNKLAGVVNNVENGVVPMKAVINVAGSYPVEVFVGCIDLLPS